MKILQFAIVLFGFSSFVHAQSSPITALAADGDTVETCLGHNICVNKGATLKRTHHFLVNSAMPAICATVPVVRTVYESTRSGASGQYFYKASCTLTPEQAVDAYEIKYVVFDIFGRHVRTLVSAAVKQIAAKEAYGVNSEWNLYSENEVGLHYTSIGYVSRLRFATGRVVVADEKLVTAAIRKIASTFDEGQLAPKAPTK